MRERDSRIVQSESDFFFFFFDLRNFRVERVQKKSGTKLDFKARVGLKILIFYLLIIGFFYLLNRCALISESPNSLLIDLIFCLRVNTQFENTFTHIFCQTKSDP